MTLPICVLPDLSTQASGANLNHMKRVTKAVFPVVGLGARFLLATKASPMVLIHNRPVYILV